MNLKNSFKKAKIGYAEALGSILLIALFILPFISFASHENKIYVNASASGTEDGSEDHPYKTIKGALKHSNKNTEVHVSKGTYRENIEIPAGTEIHGSGRDKVFIKGDDNEPVITMNGGTKIVGVTAENGEYGVEIDEGDSATIVDCIIRKNDKDGIRIKKGEVAEKDEVAIIDSDISDNGRSGISSEKRKIVITKNLISKNDKDGIFLARGSNAWISGNAIKDNDGSGMKLELDGSRIFTKSNLYSKNDREGIEVNSFGATGVIDIAQSKIRYNGRWGIAKVQRASAPASIWNGLTIQLPNVPIFGNTFGNISSVIKIF